VVDRNFDSQMSFDKQSDSRVNSHWDLMSDETGQDALRLSTNFNDKVMMIKEHLVKDNHPI